MDTFGHHYTIQAEIDRFMTASDKYEIVIGLEVHAQLKIKSKLFSTEDCSFGASPNTQISPLTIAYPGTLPFVNEKAIEFAVRMGKACHCEIAKESYFDRKNYFYPDLPKGYQISQQSTPICAGGDITIEVNGEFKKIALDHIHLEEDAGKSIHDPISDETMIDLNRAGTPLIEIVSQPAMQSSEEAFAYLTEVRRLVRWLDICDGNMEEGSLRCDANISIRPRGETRLGTKVEIKNLNSIHNLKKALDFETERMIRCKATGEPIIQQTRSFNAENGTTFVMREKEMANDYRYFPDPDLPPVSLTEQYIIEQEKQLPALPQEKYAAYLKTGLSAYDARQLSEEKDISNFFDQTAQISDNLKAIANWINGPIRQQLNENKLQIKETVLSPDDLASLIALIDEGKINFSSAATSLLPILMKENKSPERLAKELNLLQTNNKEQIHQWVEETIQKMPKEVEAFRKGKKALIGVFIGAVKKTSKGQADPKLVKTILEEKLNSSEAPQK